MGTIIARKRKDGSTGYLAQVLKKQGGRIVHREAKTFHRKQAAVAWLAKRETELAEPGGIERARAPKYMEWYGAFSLLVTLVWLYLELLRLLSKLNKK